MKIKLISEINKYKKEIGKLFNESGELASYIGNKIPYPYAFTMIDIVKVGLNPGTGFNTPAGVYAYPLSHTNFQKLRENSLPYASDKKFCGLIKLDLSKKWLIFQKNLAKSTEEDYNNCVALVSPQAKEKAEKDGINYRGANYDSMIWIMTYFESQIIAKNKKIRSTIAWASLLKQLGYVGAYDPGNSYIHESEPEQLVCLTKDAYELIKIYETKDLRKREQENIYIDPTRRKMAPETIKQSTKNLLHLYHDSLVNIAKYPQHGREALSRIKMFFKIMVQKLNEINIDITTKSLLIIKKETIDFLDKFTEDCLTVINQADFVSFFNTVLVEELNFSSQERDRLYQIIQRNEYVSERVRLDLLLKKGTSNETIEKISEIGYQMGYIIESKFFEDLDLSKQVLMNIAPVVTEASALRFIFHKNADVDVFEKLNIDPEIKSVLIAEEPSFLEGHFKHFEGKMFNQYKLIKTNLLIAAYGLNKNTPGHVLVDVLHAAEAGAWHWNYQTSDAVSSLIANDNFAKNDFLLRTNFIKKMIERYSYNEIRREEVNKISGYIFNKNNMYHFEDINLLKKIIAVLFIRDEMNTLASSISFLKKAKGYDPLFDSNFYEKIFYIMFNEIIADTNKYIDSHQSGQLIFWLNTFKDEISLEAIKFVFRKLKESKKIMTLGTKVDFRRIINKKINFLN